MLEAQGVDEDSYCLDGGHPVERYGLDDRRSESVVYYSERGIEADLRSFATEDANPTTRRR
jgi:hypothetical protein